MSKQKHFTVLSLNQISSTRILRQLSNLFLRSSWVFIPEDCFLICSLTSKKIPSASGPLIYCQKHIHHCHCRSHLPIWGCLGRKLLPVTGHTSFCIWHFSIIHSGWEKCMDVWSFHTNSVAQNEIKCAWSDWAIFQWVFIPGILVPNYSSGPRLLFLPFSCR